MLCCRAIFRPRMSPSYSARLLVVWPKKAELDVIVLLSELLKTVAPQPPGPGFPRDPPSKNCRCTHVRTYCCDLSSLSATSTRTQTITMYATASDTQKVSHHLCLVSVSPRCLALVVDGCMRSSVWLSCFFLELRRFHIGRVATTPMLMMLTFAECLSFGPRQE
jgi:hypothetical protein